MSEKIGASIIAVYEKILTTGAEEIQKEALESMEYFYQMLEKHRDLVERRIIKEEQIPVGEKVYSLFEPHTEWLSKGKANKRVELGHNLVIASDQWGFIGYHQVVEKEADVSLILPLADKLLNLFGEEGIEGFKRYCALGVLAANLHTMGSILQKKFPEKKEIVRKAA